MQAERPQSYDANQRAAVLLVCAICRVAYFVTRPEGWTICARCSK